MGGHQKPADTTVTLAAIKEFRKMLDIMEQFIRDTEAEKEAEESKQG